MSASLLLAGALVFVWMRVVNTLKEPSHQPQAVGQPGSLVWDNRVFESPAQLQAYLTSQGLSYTRWAARHPTAFGGALAPTVHPKKTSAKKATTHTTAAKRTVPKKTTPATKTAVKPTTPKPKPVETPVAVSTPAVTVTRSRPLLATILTLFLVLGAAALGGSALLPARVAPLSVQRLYGYSDRRAVALGVSAVMLLGCGVSFFLS